MLLRWFLCVVTVGLAAAAPPADAVRVRARFPALVLTGARVRVAGRGGGGRGGGFRRGAGGRRGGAGGRGSRGASRTALGRSLGAARPRASFPAAVAGAACGGGGSAARGGGSPRAGGCGHAESPRRGERHACARGVANRGVGHG